MRNGSPKFYELLDEMARTHDSKSHDYASNDNPFGNYHFAGQVSALFSHSPEDAGFASRIAEKIYRIANLEAAGKTAQNESIADTERDIAVIAVLWMADRRERRDKPNRLERELFDLIKLMPDSQTTKIINFILEMRKIREMTKHQSVDVPIGQPAYGFHAEANQGATPVRNDSEEAACEIIRLDARLTPSDRQQMIDYLRACQRDANAK